MTTNRDGADRKEVTRSAVLVRRAAIEDAETIAVLQDIANDGHLSTRDWAAPDREWHDVGADVIASGMTEMGIGNTIVAERDGVVIAMLNYATDAAADAPVDDVSRPFVQLRQRLAPCLYLRAMAVLPAARGTGVAKRLLDVALAAARIGETRAVGVIVHDGNERLLAHYKQRGFEVVATERVVSHASYPAGSSLYALRLNGEA